MKHLHFLKKQSRNAVKRNYFFLLICLLAANTIFAQQPKVNSFYPGYGGAGTVINISGNNLTGATAVTFGGVPASSFITDSAGAYIIAIVGAGATGDISVTTASGTSSISGFLFVQKPEIISFSPTSGTNGTIISIRGKNFTDTSKVSFGGTASGSVTVIGDTLINVAVGKGSSGNIIVTTVGGADTISGFTFNTPQPTISSFSPTSSAVGGTVSIYGTNLTYVTSVSFGGVPASYFKATSDTKIIATVGTGASGDVTAISAGGTATLSGFTFISPVVINSFSPTSALPATTITIKGKNFINVSGISFGGTAASSFIVISDSVISAVVAYGSSSGNVIVSTQQGSATLGGFTYIFPPPTITSFTPLIGSTGTTITITGTNFIGATSVKFGNDTAAAFSVISSTTITAIIAAGASGNVSVITPGGTASLPGFTYGFPPPTIASFTPLIGSSGTTVTITGTNLTGATSVKFANDTAASFSVVSPTTITAVVAAGASGNVSVTTPGGTASLQGFTYVPAPAINSFTPSSAGTGDTVTIKGLYFTYTSTLNFGGVAAASFIIQSDSIIKAVIGSGSSGNVAITTTYGNASLAGFIYIPPTKINSFSPKTALQGTTINVHGISFTGTTSVSFGGKAATSFIIVSDTVINAIVDNGNSGNITVTSPRGTASISGFVYLQPTKINSFTPISGGAGTTITIHGLSFTGATSVSIGGVTALSFTVVSDTVMTAMVGNGATGNVNISSPQGDATLPGFTFIPLPTITSFYPSSGPIGTNVTIVGTNFDPSTANNIVFFGMIRASIISASTDSLVVKAPAGTTFQPISVSTHSLTAYSDKPFALTFPNGGSIDSNSFAVQKDFTVDDFSTNLSIGDLDGDGKLDLATVQNNYGGIATFRNVSTDTIGLIQKKISLAIQAPSNVLIGDLDADGKPDVVVTSKANTQLALGLSVNKSTAGNIAMLNASQYFMGGEANAISIADLDNDGRPDMISTNASINNMLSIFRSTMGENTGTFSKRIDFATNREPYCLSISDIDRDGKPDIAISNSTAGNFSIFLNSSSVGNISFATKKDFATGNNPLSIGTVDIDGDGKPDVIVVNQKDSSVSIFRNTSSIGNVSFAQRIDFAIGAINSVTSNPQLFATGDLDGDGKPDLAFASVQGINVLKNTSSPGIISFAPKVTYKTTKSPITISIGDMDNDGKQDLIYLTTSTTLSILKNQVSQGPQPAIISFAPTSAKSGDTIIISGVNLSTANAVIFGEIAASSFSIVSDSVIKAVVGNGTSGKVSVTTLYGTASKDSFVFISQKTIINSFSPDSAATGTTVTIKGKNFTGTTFVSFGDIAAASFNVVSDSVITAIVGNGSTGNIIVIASGSDTISGFTFIAPLKIPQIISFTPDSGGTGNTITIKGKNFTGTTQVIFGDSAASSFIIISDSVITAIVGNGLSGNIIVKTPDGTGTIIGFTFTPQAIDSPFKLIQFSGTVVNNQPTLNWQTANEQNISSFVIQHGADSSNFNDVSTVNATGSTGPYNYGFNDLISQYQNNYYRLKIVDAAGDSTFSRVIYLQIENSPQGMKAYPNPATGYVIINNPVTTFTSYIEIIDFTGRTIKKIQVDPGIVQTRIDVSRLPSGIYVIQWSDGAKPLGLQFSVIH